MLGCCACHSGLQLPVAAARLLLAELREDGLVKRTFKRNSTLTYIRDHDIENGPTTMIDGAGRRAITDTGKYVGEWVTRSMT